MLTDQMGHFTPYDIGTALMSMLFAALLAFVVAWLARADKDPAPRELAASAAVVALAVSLVRASVPMSICLVAVVLLMRGEVRTTGMRGVLLRLAALVIGLGCGSSASLIMLVLCIPLGLLLRWATTPRA